MENARIYQEEQKRKMDTLKMEQNLPLSVIAGVAAALLMALLWAAITVMTEYQIGYMALAVGFVVGFAVRFAGKGIDQAFGITGAVLALVGCLLGNFFSIIGFAANEWDVSYFEMLSGFLAEPSFIVEVMKETFSGIDLLFYGIAVYEGYRFSFRNIEA
jgi:hypothetical protein